MGLRKFAMLMLTVAFCGPLMWAQVNTATISGTVRDPSGAVLPGASVALTNQDTGITRTVTANAAGRYNAPALPLGNYQVRAQLQGFQTEVRSGIVLTVGRQAVVDFTLQVGAVTQTVEVTGEAPLIELTNANITGLVDDRTIRELPLNGRSYDQLALLQPGVVKYTTAGQGFNGSPGGNKFSSSGSLATSNSFLLDGTDINDASNNTPGGASGTNMGVDTIKEFKIISGAFNAEYGRGSGAVVSAVTRSGTNQLHGTGFEFIRNSALDARRFRDDIDFNNDGTGDVPPFRRNQFGGTLGGPIVRDKTFYFGGYEGLREALSNSTEAKVPTQAVKQGILPLADGSGTYTVTPDPRIVPYLALYPDPQTILPFPNSPGLDSAVGIYKSAPKQISRQDYFMGRVDHQLTNGTNIFGRYSFDDDIRSLPDLQGNFNDTDRARRQYVTVQANSVVSPTIVNSARAALNRTSQNQSEVLINSALEGYTWVPGLPIGTLGVGVTNGIAVYDDTGGDGTRPRQWTYNLWEWGDDMTYVHGTHTFKWGGVIRRVQNNNNVQTDLKASYNFLTPERLITVNTENGEWSGTLPGDSGYKGIRNTMYGFYFQDDYQVTPRLTMNMGLRWEWITDPTEANNKISNQLSINDNPDQIALHPDWRSAYPNITGPDLFAYTEMTKKNIQPRFGFAWQMDENASRVLRGGAGIYHDLVLPAYYTQSLSKYPPFYSRARIRDADVLQSSFPLASQVVTGDAVRLRNEPLLPQTKQPVKYSYTLALQQQLGERGVIEIAYVGSQQRHLERYFQLNDPIPEMLAGGIPYHPSRSGGSEACLPAPYGGWDGVSALPKRCPSTSVTGIRRNAIWDRIRQRGGDANAHYNGLQVRFSRQTASGAIFQANYTYSRVMNIQGGLNTEDNGTRDPNTSLDPANPVRDYGRAAFDSTHVFTTTGTLPLPFQFDNGAANTILGGWTASGVFTALSGQPMTPNLGFDWSRQGNSGASDRPDINPNFTGNAYNPTSGTMSDGTPVGTADHWYNPEAYVLPNPLGLATPQPGFYGNLGRNTIIGPRLFSLDFTLTKGFVLGEGKDLTFRAEFFNIMNRPNLGLPNNEPLDPDAANSGQSIPLGGAGRIPADQTTTSARQIQFGLKFTF